MRIESLDNLIVAHRGESYDAPENTLESINLAWQNNIKAVELDIHLTKDNQIVVIHDKDTLRTSGVKKIIEKSRYDELKNLDVGSFKKPWKNVRIPLLADVLNTVPEKSKLVIEIKSDKKVVKFLKQLFSKQEYSQVLFEIISFNLETIAFAKKQFPDIKCLWLLDLDYYWWNFIIGIRSKKLVEKLQKFNLDGANLFAGKMANFKFVDRLLKNSFKVYVWTVNEPSVAHKFLNMGVTGITTDRPSWLLAELKNNYYNNDSN